MTSAQFLVTPGEVEAGLNGHPQWWRAVFSILLSYSNFKTGNVETWVPAIRRRLEDEYRVKTRQGTTPCEKSIRRVLAVFRAKGWLGMAGEVNRSYRRILGTLRGTLGHLLGHKKSECPSPVSKWQNRWATGEKQGGKAPVSKSSVQGFQAGSPIFKNGHVDNSGHAPNAIQRAALDALRAKLRR